MLCVLLAGCSGSSSGGSAGASGPCGQRNGTYRVTFAERSGDCGPAPEQIFTPSDQQQQQTNPSCTDRTTVSADSCHVTLDVICPVVATGDTVHDKGVINWAEDGSMGGGIVQIVATTPAGAIVCAETYDVTYSKQ